jgi:hypothetical protein
MSLAVWVYEQVTGGFEDLIAMFRRGREQDMAEQAMADHQGLDGHFYQH